MKKGQNLQSIKVSNRAAVLYLLNESGPLSRKQLAEQLELTPAAVTKITANLLSEGAIQEKEAVGNGVGRREVLLDLQFGELRAFGIHFERDEITFSVSGLEGTLYDRESMAFTADFDEVLRNTAAYYEKVRTAYHFLGAGISLIGHSDSYGIWPDRDICAEFSDLLSMPVVVRNNVQAFSYASVLFSETVAEKNVLVFKWGPGIGSAFIRAGKVLSGDDQGASEIGHVIMSPGGKKCRCGKCGCLETETALDVISEEAMELGYNLPVSEILDSDIPELQKLLDRKMDMVCLAILNASTILDAKRIIVFGSAFRSRKFCERFRAKWEAWSGNQETIAVSRLNDKVSYVGCTAMVARKLFFEKTR